MEDRSKLPTRRAGVVVLAALLALSMIGTARPAVSATEFLVDVMGPSGRPVDALLPGDEVTLGIRLSGGTGFLALSASAWGYDESVVDFVRGEAVPYINYPLLPILCWSVAFCIYTHNSLVPIDGRLTNGPLSESPSGEHGSRVHFVDARQSFPTRPNLWDLGLDHQQDYSDPQFRIVFRAMGLGESVIHIGTGYPGDGETGPDGLLDTSANVPIRIKVIPEPGTALLLLSGLTALSSRRRSTS